MEESGIGVGGRGGEKGSGPRHAENWEIEGRGEDDTVGDMIGGGPHDNIIPFRTPPPLD
jgi:hypothetical protein